MITAFVYLVIAALLYGVFRLLRHSEQPLSESWWRDQRRTHDWPLHGTGQHRSPLE